MPNCSDEKFSKTPKVERFQASSSGGRVQKENPQKISITRTAWSEGKISKSPKRKEAELNRPDDIEWSPETGTASSPAFGTTSEREPIMDTAVNDNQVSNNVSDSQMTQKQSPAFPVRGHLSAVEVSKDKNDKPYAKAKLTFTRRKDNREVTVTTMAFGKAFDSTQHLFVEGPVALYGTFERNVFRVISEALPPKEQAAA
jgi:hypothetical protein